MLEYERKRRRPVEHVSPQYQELTSPHIPKAIKCQH